MSKHKPAASVRCSVHPSYVRRRSATGSLAMTKREQIRNRRGCLRCCADRDGATIATVKRTTGWQPHTVCGFLTAVVRKKLGLRLESEKTDGERVYRIVAGKNSADAADCEKP